MRKFIPDDEDDVPMHRDLQDEIAILQHLAEDKMPVVQKTVVVEVYSAERQELVARQLEKEAGKSRSSSSSSSSGSSSS